MRRILVWALIAVVAAAGYFYKDQWVPRVSPYLPAQIVALVPGLQTPAPTDGKAAASGGGKRSGSPITVAVAKAEAGSLPITRQTIGTVVSLATANLTGSVTGILAEVKVADGAAVKKGDLIALIDSRAARATLVKDQSTLAKDQANLDNLNQTMQRTLDLTAKGVFSKQNADDATTAAKVAEQLVNVDKAAVSADQVAISLTEVHAPFDGKLGTILLSPGAWVGATSVIATITQVDPVYAEFVLPDADADLARSNFASGKLSVSVVPQGNKLVKPVEGPVVFVDHAIDPASGTLKMRASLPNADASLLIGQSLAIKFVAGTMDNLVLVPNVAVTPTATGNAVYVVKDDNTIEVRPVEVAMRGDKLAGLSKGLQVGEKVVIEGQVNLSNGSQVKISDGAPVAQTGVAQAGAAAATGGDAALADPTKKGKHKKKDGTATAVEATTP